MKITTKLIASFAAVIALSGVMAVVAYRGLLVTSYDLEEMGTVRKSSIEGLMQIKIGMNGARAANTALALDWLPTDAQAAQKTYRDASFQDIRDGWARYEPLPHTEKCAHLWKEFVTKFRA